MSEFEAKYPSWREQIKNAVFYENRGDIVRMGNQSVVYRNKWMDFVLKVPLDESNLLVERYQIADQRSPEQIVPFIVTEGITLIIDRRKQKLEGPIIVQEKIDELTPILGHAINTRNLELAELIVTGEAQSVRTMFDQGVYIPDHAYINYGMNKEGEVKLFDPGSAVDTFPTLVDYLVFAFNRGKNYYVTFASLYAFFERKGITTPNGTPIHKLFQEVIGLHFNTDLELTDLMRYQDKTNKSWSPEAILAMIMLVHSEFEKHSSSEPPFDINNEVQEMLATIQL